MKQALIISSLFFLLAGFSTTSEEVSNEFPDQNILAEFEFTKGDICILLPVKFKGKEYLL